MGPKPNDDHEVGVVHRDITPSNMLVCARGLNEMFIL